MTRTRKPKTPSVGEEKPVGARPGAGGARPGSGRRKLPPEVVATRTVGVRLSVPVYEQVRVLAREMQTSVPAVLRMALEAFLKNVSDNQK